MFFIVVNFDPQNVTRSSRLMNRPRERHDSTLFVQKLEIRAFGTPTVVHFCVALVISAILSAPWAALGNAAVAVGACGAAGILYVLTVIRHARRQTGYAPDAEDWFWYSAFPLVAYSML